MRFPALACIALIITPSAALAGGGHEAEAIVRHIFSSADQNGDGNLTRAEFEQAGLQRFGASFDQSDLDADGVTSQAEYLELYLRHHTAPERGDA